MKRIALSLAVVMVLALSGCTSLFVPRQGERAPALPTPPAQSMQAPVGDSYKEQLRTVALYYIGGDQRELVPLTRPLLAEGDDALIEAVVERLLTDPGRDDARAVAPEGTRLLSCELANGIATVNLSADARNQTPESLAYMRAAISNTLVRLGGVQYVNVLVTGQVESASSEEPLPPGLLPGAGNDLAAVWLGVQADAERLRRDSTPAQLDAYAALYFASTQNERLIPEAKRVRYSSDDLILQLLRELVLGPVGLTAARGVLPEDLEPIAGAPFVTTSGDGRRLIVLPFNEDFEGEMTGRNRSLQQIYGALTLTLCRFVPEIEGIQVRVGERVVDSVRLPTGEVQLFEGGVMTTSDFSPLVGDLARVYLANEDGKLAQVSRAMDPYASKQPRALIEQLIAGPLEGEALQAVVPQGVTAADVLGVRVEDDTVLVNLSSNFYRCCQSLSAQQERLLVYAIVNTLTELDGLRKVRFFVEDETLDTLAHGIYLHGSLIRNPGLIAE